MRLTLQTVVGISCMRKPLATSLIFVTCASMDIEKNDQQFRPLKTGHKTYVANNDIFPLLGYSTSEVVSNSSELGSLSYTVT